MIRKSKNIQRSDQNAFKLQAADKRVNRKPILVLRGKIDKTWHQKHRSP
jgi:hypothetical protein